MIASGAFAIDLDPTVFGEISDVTVFGATGDATGYANVMGRHAEVHFSSSSGSIGQLSGLPVAVVSAPVNVGTASESRSIRAWARGWTQPGGPIASPSRRGSFERRNIWVGSVTPGGGHLPARAALRIDGGGFDAATQITVEGVGLGAAAGRCADTWKLTLAESGRDDR